MFAGVSHPYMTQVVALWLSFLPAIAIGLFIFGAQFERNTRRSATAWASDGPDDDRFN
jgi:hypothetical protein